MKFLVFFALLIGLNVYGQDDLSTKVAEFKRVIEKADNDTVVINALKEWDNLIYRTDEDLDLKLNLTIDSIASKNLAKKLSSKEKDFFLKARGGSSTNLGLIYNAKGKNTIALDYLQKSLIAKKKRNDTEGIAKTLNNIGSIYHEQGYYEKAVYYYTRALKLHEKMKNRQGIGGALNNLAIIHRYEGNYETAMEFYDRSLRLKREDNDSNAVAAAYINKGRLYKDMKRYADARKSLLMSLEISEKTNNQENIALAYVYLGLILYEQQKVSEALEYYNKGYEVQQAIGDGKMLAQTAVYLAEVYFDLGKNNEAKDYGEKALTLSYKNDVIKYTEKATAILHKIYSREGNFQKALKMLEENIAINEKINNEENRKAVIRQEFMYQYEKKAAADSIKAAQVDRIKDAELGALRAKKKQQELRVKQQQQQQLFLFAGLIIMLVFAGFLYNRFRVTRAQKRVIEEQKKQVDEAYSELDIEKMKSDNLLRNILPEEIAEELKTKGASTPTHYEQATVLFTDFKGFTKNAAEASPQDLVKTLNECFTAFDAIIHRHNLEKIKTIGDAYMCAGGVPVKNTTNAVDAIRAAREMVKWVQVWNDRRAEEQLPKWEIRIGIHTGELVAGVIGTSKMAYDVWGDAVNVASRIESAGEPGRINISASTQSRIKDEFETEYRGEIEVKNRGAIGMYFLK